MSGTRQRKKVVNQRIQLGVGGTEQRKPNEKLFEFFFSLNGNEERESVSVFVYFVGENVSLFFLLSFARTTEKKIQQAPVFATKMLVKVKAPSPISIILLLLRLPPPPTRHYYIGKPRVCDCIQLMEVRWKKILSLTNFCGRKKRKNERIWMKTPNIIGTDSTMLRQSSFIFKCVLTLKKKKKKFGVCV